RSGTGGPGRVATAVVVSERNGDAVSADLLLQLLHVGRVGVRTVLVLHLVQDHRAGAVRELVARDDRIDVPQPLAVGGGVVGGARASTPLLRREPAGEAAAVGLRV